MLFLDAKSKWDEKYLERLEDQSKPIANGRLQGLSRYLTGGKALDFACGLGANSLFLAERGYEVEAFDISDVAIEHVREQALAEGLSVLSQMIDLTDLENIHVSDEAYDLVIITYYLDRSLFPLVKAAIKDQGYFFMETFYKSPIGEGRVSDHFKLQPGELLTEFADWQVLFYEENELEGRQTIFARKR